MRIAWITTGFSKDENDHGGAGAVHNLAREISLNPEVELSIFSFYYPFNQPKYKFYNAEVLSFAGDNMHTKIDKPSIWRRCMKKFDSIHREKNFDIIHSLWAGESGYIASKLSNKYNIPMVVSILGGELAEIKEIKYGTRLKFWQKRFVDTSLNKADKIISGSDFIIDKLQYYYGNEILKKTEKIPLGVDENIFYPINDNNTGNKKYQLINIANAVPVKSLETLFKALKIVSEKFDSIKLNIYGKDEKGILDRMSAEIGVKKNVKMHGFIDYNIVPKVLNESGIFVLSSLYESQNMAMVEAAFCGLPVISTDVGVAKEITEHVVKPGDFLKLAEMILNVINNYENEKKMALQKINSLHEKFSLKEVTDKYKMLYSKIL